MADMAFGFDLFKNCPTPIVLLKNMTPDKLRNILNYIFLVLAVAAVITYFVARDDFKLFLYVCGAAIFVKVLEFIIRFTNR